MNKIPGIDSLSEEQRLWAEKAQHSDCGDNRMLGKFPRAQ